MTVVGKQLVSHHAANMSIVSLKDEHLLYRLATNMCEYSLYGAYNYDVVVYQVWRFSYQCQSVE